MPSRATDVALTSPSSVVPSPATVAALRETLRDLPPGGPLPGAVDAVLRDLCAEAHRAGLRPESLLVAVKPVLHELPEVRALPSLARTELLSRIVCLCIQHYFARPAAGPS